MTIHITRFTIKPDAAEDQIEESDCETVPEALKHFDQEATALLIRCSNDKEYFGIIYGVGRPNRDIANKVLESVEPGQNAKDPVRWWEFKGNLVEGSGWRLHFGSELKLMQKPKVPPAEPVERGSAIGKPVAVEKTETKNGEARP